MSDVFGGTYSSAYDALYADKDYEAECAILGDLFRAAGVKSVLDLGCGTGGHSSILARAGYEVTAVDRSEEMLARARVKAGAKVRFVASDIRDLTLGREFDAVLMMFAVLGYMTDNEDVIRVLTVARRHLRVGGLLAFDVWYGPAVLRDGPSVRIKSVAHDGVDILRTASGSIDESRCVCTVDYEVWRVAGDRILERVRESHQMRFFFPRELELFLKLAGFEVVRTSGFPDVDSRPGESGWGMLVEARAVAAT